MSDKDTAESSSQSDSAYGKVQTVGNSSNIAWHHSSITKDDIYKRNNHRSSILWFTGLSGSGKSTLANAVNNRLFQISVMNGSYQAATTSTSSRTTDTTPIMNTRATTETTPIHSYLLDGDNIRHGINQDLGFSDEDRVENIRRIGHIASLFLDAGMIVLTAFVSPFRSDREQVRTLVNKNGCENEFIEIYCSANLDVCEDRDTKGLYKKAREGIILEFTGISSPYEIPDNPEIVVESGTKSLEECVDQIMLYLEDKEIIPKSM
jgi:adenylylsulfate kinase